MHARKLGQINPEARAWLLAWIKQEPLAEVTKSSYVHGRLEKWYRRGSNLQSLARGHAQLFKCPDPPDRLIQFGDRSLPGWHSLLVCGGPTSIHWHRDHGHFERQAVMINLGRAVYRELDKEVVESLTLEDGDVVELDIKVIHVADQLSPVRFNFCFRRIKPEFLATPITQPSLF